MKVIAASEIEKNLRLVMRNNVSFHSHVTKVPQTCRILTEKYSKQKQSVSITFQAKAQKAKLGL